MIIVLHFIKQNLDFRQGGLDFRQDGLEFWKGGLDFQQGSLDFRQDVFRYSRSMINLALSAALKPTAARDLKGGQYNLIVK